MEAKDPKWQEQFDGILGGLQEWRKQHPKATFAEIEQETLKRTAALQAQLSAALASIGEKRPIDRSDVSLILPK